MKRKLSIMPAFVLAVFLAFDASTSQAQPPAPPATTPTPGVVPGPGVPPVPHPRRRPPAPGMVYRRTIMSLRQAKAQLEHAEGDLGGHKQSAMDACDKAIEELDAAMKSIPPAPQPAPPPPSTPPSQ